jgi:hypothetical protein
MNHAWTPGFNPDLHQRVSRAARPLATQTRNREEWTRA